MRLMFELSRLLLTVAVFAAVMPLLLGARWLLVGVAWVTGARR
jgi:hypothetical protein